MAPMVTATGLGAGAGVGVRAAAAEGQGQAPDHLGDGHGDGRGQREVDGQPHLAAQVAAASAAAIAADADAPAVFRAVGHVASGGERGAGGRVEQRRHDGADERQENARLLVLALLPHAQEHGDRAQERRHGVRDHKEPARKARHPRSGRV
jgi:hypothetical protein